MEVLHGSSSCSADASPSALRAAVTMGRKVAIQGEAISGSSTCNLIDSFGYVPGIGAPQSLSLSLARALSFAAPLSPRFRNGRPAANCEPGCGPVQGTARSTSIQSVSCRGSGRVRRKSKASFPTANMPQSLLPARGSDVVANALPDLWGPAVRAGVSHRKLR